MQRTIVMARGPLSRSGVHHCLHVVNSTFLSHDDAFHTLLMLGCNSRANKVKSPCSPISQILDTLLPVAGNRDHGLQRELPATGSPKQESISRGGSSSVLNATGLAIGKQSTFFSS